MKVLRQNKNGWDQEVSGIFVKVLMDLVSGTSGSAKFYTNAKLYKEISFLSKVLQKSEVLKAKNISFFH